MAAPTEGPYENMSVPLTEYAVSFPLDTKQSSNVSTFFEGSVLLTTDCRKSLRPAVPAAPPVR